MTCCSVDFFRGMGWLLTFASASPSCLYVGHGVMTTTIIMVYFVLPSEAKYNHKPNDEIINID